MFVKKDRILIEFEDEGIFIGTVSVIRQGKIHVIFDDGDKMSFALKSKRILGKGTKLKRKSAIPKKLLKKYTEPDTKDKLKKKVVKKLGKPDFKLAKSGDDEARMVYLRDIWGFLNKMKFSKMLKEPTIIRWTKDASLKDLKKHGHWNPRYRELAFSRRMFNETEKHAIDLILHEMAHQAVSEISKVKFGRHGQHWRAWMKRIGLKPKATATESESDSMLSPKELADKQRVGDKLLVDMKGSKPVKKDELAIGLCVKFRGAGKILLGRIVYIVRGKRKTEVIISSTQKWNVGSSNLFHCLDVEKADVTKTLSDALVEKETAATFRRKDAERQKRKLKNN